MIDKILVVGAGANQQDLIHKSEAKGYECYVLDSRRATLEKSAGTVKICLQRNQYSDVDSLIAERKINAVVTDQSDFANIWAAEIRHRNNIPGNSLDSVQRTTNKLLMREAIQQALPQYNPFFRLCQSKSELESFKTDFSKNQQKFLKKPISGQGSLGVEILDKNFEEKDTKFEPCLIEEYIHGDEYSIECFVNQNTIYTLVVTKKKHYSSNKCLDQENQYFGDISEKLQNSLQDVNNSVISALGITSGITHSEYIYDGSSWFLVEIASRGGGSGISNAIVPYLTGFDPQKALIDQTSKLLPDSYFKFADYRKRFALMRFITAPKVLIKKISFPKDYDSNIIFKSIDFISGFQAINPKSSVDRLGVYVVVGESAGEIVELANKIDSEIEFF
jgi:predicted ATP-grasp superfamily ATP-dependent carboligase